MEFRRLLWAAGPWRMAEIPKPSQKFPENRLSCWNRNRYGLLSPLRPLLQAHRGSLLCSIHSSLSVIPNAMAFSNA